ncbi:MAG: hypothetical protein IPJ37_16420 [Bacteroidales bacterium]|nr:hypothetical protein [Bacteroidales bacterium]
MGKNNLTNLLSHTAELLTIHGFPGYEKEIRTVIIQILDGQKPANTEAVRSFSEPGKSFSYSGGGTTVSQRLLQM